MWRAHAFVCNPGQSCGSEALQAPHSRRSPALAVRPPRPGLPPPPQRPPPEPPRVTHRRKASLVPASPPPPAPARSPGAPPSPPAAGAAAEAEGRRGLPASPPFPSFPFPSLASPRCLYIAASARASREIALYLQETGKRKEEERLSEAWPASRKRRTGPARAAVRCHRPRSPAGTDRPARRRPGGAHGSGAAGAGRGARPRPRRLRTRGKQSSLRTAALAGGPGRQSPPPWRRGALGGMCWSAPQKPHKLPACAAWPGGRTAGSARRLLPDPTRPRPVPLPEGCSPAGLPAAGVMRLLGKWETARPTWAEGPPASESPMLSGPPRVAAAPREAGAALPWWPWRRSGRSARPSPPWWSRRRPPCGTAAGGCRRDPGPRRRGQDPAPRSGTSPCTSAWCWASPSPS